MCNEQLEADVTAIKNDKMQVQNLMTQVKMMHEEDSKRFGEDLARVNRDCERKVAASLAAPPPIRSPSYSCGVVWCMCGCWSDGDACRLVPSPRRLWSTSRCSSLLR